jgi:hypothetical protein
MNLTKEQIRFLDNVCEDKWKLNSKGVVDVDGHIEIYDMKLTEIPVKFGRVNGYFNCGYNKLTTLKNCPDSVGSWFSCNNNNITSLDCIKESHIEQSLFLGDNNLTDYFKNIKEEDFPYWKNLHWGDVIPEYPFLINIGKKYFKNDGLKYYLNEYPSTKLYFK